MQIPHTKPFRNGHAQQDGAEDALPSDLIGQVAAHFCGAPNERLSKTAELRFGSRGSLSVDLKRGIWFDHEHQIGGGLLDLIEHFSGLKGRDRQQWLVERGFLQLKPRRSSSRAVAEYDYRDAEGRLRYQVQRLVEPKRFRQRRPSPQGRNGWVYDLDGIDPLPYRLSDVVEAAANGQRIVVVEGEKDADNLARIGIVASCNSGGANNWPESISPYFEGAEIIIINDNDDAGRKHAQKVAVSLKPVATSVGVLDLATYWPECPHKGDISDWLAAGGTREDLDALLERATLLLSPGAVQNGAEPAQTHDTHQTHHANARRIRLIRGERARILAEVLALLHERGDLFERGGELVRVTTNGVEPVTDDWLLSYFDSHAAFFGVRRRGDNLLEEPRDAPPWLGRRVIAQKGDWGLRTLQGVISAPTMRADGTLLVEHGYDHRSSLFLLPGAGRPLVPETPSASELKAAAERLWLPFAKFPFVDIAARSVMLAAIFTAVVRQTLAMAPGFTFDAPSAGTGKTLLGFCLLGLCGMGRKVIPECRNEEEVRKRLLSTLRSGHPCMLLDNIRGQFGSAALETMLTTDRYSDRLLGGSTMLELPTITLVLISGNNFRPAGDLWRRLLTCRIDAGVEAPERRSFNIQPFEHCCAHRQEIVATVLTLLRGFAVAGSPRITSDRLASFESWDDRIRQAVIWIGERQFMPDGAEVGDPVDAMERTKTEEPDRQRLAAMLVAARATMGDGRWRVAELIKKTEPGDPGAEEQIGTLREVLEDIAGDRGTINPRKLGRWIEKQADRRCRGMWFKRAGERSNMALWRIEGQPSEGA